MLYGNVDQFGGALLDTVEKEFESASDVQIASGYISLDILNKFRGDFTRIAQNNGSAKLLLGMAFYEGLTNKKLEVLMDMSNELESINDQSGVYVCYSNKFHGKIYSFGRGEEKNVYLGSSNFSRSGLEGNIECTALVEEGALKERAGEFVDFIFHEDNAVSILKAEITVPGTTRYNEKLKLDTLDDLEKYDPATLDLTEYEYFDYPLDRIVTKEKSNLNVYFGRGRWARATGKVLPRPWYEVELIANRDINSNPLYPQGDFIAYTDDGYIMPMRTSGDYFKNIRSRGGLQILGQWIKGKLQKSGALIPLTPVTQDTLDTYGKDSIRFYKIGDGKYFMEF